MEDIKAGKNYLLRATGSVLKFDGFLKVYEEYKKAPDVTRQRLYLETMERLFGGTDKIIVDPGASNGTGVVPYLPLNELIHKPTSGAPTGGTR